MAAQPSTDPVLPMLRFGLALLIVAALYLGQDVLIPIALAILLSFVLAPAADRLERWRVPSAPSVIIVVTAAFLILGAVGLMVANQVVSLAESLPKYRENITARSLSLRGEEGGVFDTAAETLFAIQEDIKKKPQATHSARETPIADETASSALTPPEGNPQPAVKPRTPVPVEVIDQPPTAVKMVKDYVSPALIPIARLGLAVVLVIFFLLQREDLRDRLIRIMSRERLDVTTRALNDAGDRIGRYLRTQLLINACYGVPIAIGLALIGLPGAVLWGLLAMLLRFIPYVGPWLAASMPILLSLAVFDGWLWPLGVVALFISLELFTNMVMEPWLYGASTGLSPVAVLLAVIFWSWLWGGIGLLLAIPLTVCVVVAGRHLHQFEFFTILLGKEPALSAPERFYQRLLAGNPEEALALAQEHAANGLMSLYDQVVIPALVLAERDRHDGRLDLELEQSLTANVREIVETLGEQLARQTSPAAATMEDDKADFTLLCLPSRDSADELTARMFTQVLNLQAVPAEAVSVKALVGEMIARTARRKHPVVCISAVPPKVLAHTRYLCKRLKQQSPRAKIAVGLWHETGYATRLTPKLTEAGADVVVSSFEAGVKWARQRMHEHASSPHGEPKAEEG